MFRVVVEMNTDQEATDAGSEQAADTIADTFGGSIAGTTAGQSGIATQRDDHRSDGAQPRAVRETETVEFTVGTSKTTASCTGRLHLYRWTAGDNPALPYSPVAGPMFGTETLCVLAVPAYMTAADFCNYVAVHAAKIRTMRILKDAAVENRYMVIITMASVHAADEFGREFDGKLFSTISDERCRVLAVADLTEVTAAEAKLVSQDRPQDPLGIEMPTCPVCLERLDSVTSGVVTSLCNHTMHCSCLSKWGDNSCPVCRFCQEATPESNACMTCGTTTSLWMCLICGHVGCGRYVDFHALAHFKDTSHTFSIELETNRVWDYAGDNYVHRIVVNKTDGKLVELPPCVDEGHNQAASESGRRPNQAQNQESCTKYTALDQQEDDQVLAAQYASKLDIVTTEFDHLLRSQLESQRLYYENRIERSESALGQSLAETQEKLRDVLLENERLRDSINQADKERSSSCKKARDFEKIVTEKTRDCDFLQSLNENLIRNQGNWKKKLAKAEDKILELENEVAGKSDELRDMFMHIETLSAIIPGPGQSELAGAGLVRIADSPQPRRRAMRGRAR